MSLNNTVSSFRETRSLRVFVPCIHGNGFHIIEFYSQILFFKCYKLENMHIHRVSHCFTTSRLTWIEKVIF
jgi:hypothetical protein